MVPVTYAILSLACAVGTGFGLAGRKVWAVIPTSLIFMLVTVTLGAYSDLTWGRIALVTFCVLTTLQISYLVGTALSKPTQVQRIYRDRQHWRQLEYLHRQAVPLILSEFTTSPAQTNPVGTLVLPQTQSGNNMPVSAEYGSSSEAQLQLSGDGHYLAMAGYATNAQYYNSHLIRMELR
jgi:hypothetical protein